MRGDAELQREYERLLPLIRSDEWATASAAYKRDVLWEAMTSNPYAELPKMRVRRIMTWIRLANLGRLAKAFHVEDDIRPPRTKAFHPWGTVAKVRFDAADGHPYTGLLQSGALAFARLSLARDDRSYSPSAAFKFFVDSRPNEHVVLDQSVDEQTSRDFFERAPTNITLWPQRGTLKYQWIVMNWWLGRIADPLHQYLDNLASVTADGRTVEQPRAPYRISFYCPPELHNPPDAKSDFRVDIAKIPAGSVLYHVYATASPDEEDPIKVGTITTETPFVASPFADRVLAMRHSYSKGAEPWARTSQDDPVAQTGSR
jgi:hypothetical protein